MRWVDCSRFVWGVLLVMPNEMKINEGAVQIELKD